jgi:hypothetical protein
VLQCDCKLGTGSLLGLHGYLTLMKINDFAAQRKADSITICILFIHAPVKRTENVRNILRWNTDSMVLEFQHNLVVQNTDGDHT